MSRGALGFWSVPVILIHEWLFVLALCLGFAAAGAFAVLPFRRDFAYPALFAPLFGVVLTTLGTVGFYVLLQRSFATAFLLSAVCCLGASWWSWRASGLRFTARGLGLQGAALAAVSLAAAAALTATAQRNGGPALLFMDGTDHTFYIHAATWLLNHRVTELPHFTFAGDPYIRWILPTFLYDTSSGAYGLSAVVALLRGLPPMFAYDDAAAVVLTCGVLAVAGVFARRPLVLLLLLAGLFTSHWFDYSRTGYFGKLLGYPSAITLAAVAVAAFRQPLDSFRIALLGLLTMAAALTKYGMVTIVFLVVIAGGFLVARFLLEQPRRDRRLLSEGVLVLGLMILIALSGAGTLTRLENMGYPDWHLTWDFIFARMFDLDNQGVGLTGLDVPSLIPVALVALSVHLALAVIAVRRRDALASALLIVPLIEMAALMASGSRATAFQLIGTFHPLALCGAATLLNGPTADAAAARAARARPGWRTVLPVAMLALVAVGLRVPRFAGALDRYAYGPVPAMQQFTMADFDALAAAIGTETVEVDLPEPTHTLAILADLGRRGLDMQWGERSWQWMVVYTPHPPVYEKPATLHLRLRADPVPAGATVLLETRQFRLWR